MPSKYGVFFIGHNDIPVQVRVAVLIKKSVGNAVVRNYCKRIVRAYIRNRIDTFFENGQVIFVYTYTGKTKYNLLEEEFDKKLAVL